jgi:hypothetical protein
VGCYSIILGPRKTCSEGFFRDGNYRDSQDRTFMRVQSGQYVLYKLIGKKCLCKTAIAGQPDQSKWSSVTGQP